MTKELLDLFNIDEKTLYTQGLQITTTIDPQAQRAAEKAVSTYLDGQDPEMRAAVVSIDPHSGAVRAYYGGADANGFDFAQAGCRPGRRSRSSRWWPPWSKASAWVTRWIVHR
ncbi:membrane carboxypeptidase domain protein [Mycobacterium xenopi 3993]|nr:membrane carboxypeptidase domain protein [Mycobacterium xenopi 3993]